MTNEKSTKRYEPTGQLPAPVTSPGEFTFAATHFDHGHIYGQTQGLIEAGATLKWIYEQDDDKANAFLAKFPQAKRASSLDQILNDSDVQLVASAAIPDERCAIGIRVMEAGKDYFVAKAPFTTLSQLEQARAATLRTTQKYMVYYSERLHVESAMHATKLLREGAIGKIVQIMLLAPHTLNKPIRPEWFFQKQHYAGILTDIGSHQFEQFLAFTGAQDATVNYARVGNFHNNDTPEFEDFGEAALTTDTGTACYCKIDWLTPKGSPTWGDGRVFITGTKGSMEIRKYHNLGGATTGNVIYLTDEQGQHTIECEGKVGHSFFGQLIQDCINRTENAMTQAHAFKAAELSMQAQALADSAVSSV